MRTAFALLSTLLLLVAAPGLRAHEIRPAISDVTVAGNAVTIELQLTLETLVAGLDVSGIANTNDSPLAARYDALRALEPDALVATFDEAWPRIAAGFRILAGARELTPEVVAVEVPPVGELSLPRESRLVLRADLPDDGSPVSFGWDAAYGPLVVRQVLPAGDGYSGYLTGGEMSVPMPRTETARQPWLTAFLDYVGIGYIHILPKGLDHILFVLGLFFFSLQLRPLIYQVTAFTVAHTVTLALAVLGIVSVPSAVVEPLIAASIVYVAIENILLNRLRPWRTAVVFGFGLLHGLGFASVLGDIGLQAGRFVTGLVGFNLGVELGQLSVIALAFLLLGLPFGRRPW